MREKAINALIELDIPTDIKGFHYILDAIMIFTEDESFIYDKTIQLYSKIAEKHNSSASKVERAIRHAFSIALNVSNWENPAIDKYLSRKYTANGQLLGMLYLRLSTMTSV